MINFLVDFILSNVISWGIITLLILPNMHQDYTFGKIFLAYFLIRFLYYFICEALFRRTLGQHLTKSKVVTINQETPSLLQYLIRTATRTISAAGSFVSDDLQAFHDKCSSTYVIKKEAESSELLDL